MTTVAIIYFSGYGHTKKLAEAVQLGAEQAGAKATLYAISQEGELNENELAEIGKAEAIIYGTPTYMAGPAWQFKKFADATSKIWFMSQWKDKVAAGFTNSASTNGDKGQTLNYLFTFAQQHGQIWVGLGLLPSNTKAHSSKDINWSGGSIGVMAISPSDASPEEAPHSGDIEAAKALGTRVTEITKKLYA